MKIIRNGIEIELTKEELYGAWDEQQDWFDKESLRFRLEDSEYSQEDVEKIIDIALPIYNKDRNYGCDESWSFDDAVSEAIDIFKCA